MTTLLKKICHRILVICCFAIPFSSFAQLAGPNSQGASMGHIHFQSTDLEASAEFWGAFGATTVQNGPIQMYAIPGVYILVREAESSSGSVGTLIDHLGVEVANNDILTANLEAAGFVVETTNTAGRINVYTPSDMLIEVRENQNLSTTAEFNHIHFYNPEYEAMQQWYVDMFGAEPSSGEYIYGYIPGVNLTFSNSEEARPAIQGTVLDHIGFEVVDLEATLAKLEAADVPITLSYRVVPDTDLAIAFVMDPWGTNIELTQGLTP